MFNSDEEYKKYSEIVYKYLYSLCRNQDVAEELTQETFYRAIKSSKNFTGECKVTTWLCQIAKHIWYQDLEKKSKKKTVSLSEDFVSLEDNPEQVLTQKSEKMSLMKDIHNLKGEQKEVVLLRITGRS
ncbi:MAG: RNA polymerase sigma factor, partial [Acutalibacteraceae bacterium]